ncbi:hypothetical protein N183_19420 [Sinorhizobium sp. Sb3]|nr:hypothetical protein N183_19420 [Sinorhizobium sp. Sb3]
MISQKFRSDVIVGLNQFDVTDIEDLSQLVEGDHGRISPAAFQAADVLLAEAGARFDLFLSQALLPTQAGKVAADQFAHVHAPEDRDLHTLSLSTIICKRECAGYGDQED